MIPTLKLIISLFIVSIQNKVCFTNSVDFQTDVNLFIDAFNEASYSTEHNETVPNEVSVRNEIPVDAPVMKEDPTKNNEVVISHIFLDTIKVKRVKRETIGGFIEVDVDEATEYAKNAIQTMDRNNTELVVTKVIQAQKQLLNGTIHLMVEVALTDCREGQEACQDPLKNYNICKILMQQLFSGEAQVLKTECTPVSSSGNKKRRKRDISQDGNKINSMTNDIPKKKKTHRLRGGRTDQDPNAAIIKEMAEFALTQINKESNSLNKQEIVRVVEARSQVVAGVKYFLKLELVETDCRKDSNQVNCSPINSKVLQECDVVIWDQPWMKYRAMTRSNCRRNESLVIETL